MKRFTTRLANSAQKSRLDDFLADWLPQVLGSPFSRSRIRSLILSGAVYVNRHRNKIPSTLIFGGAVLEVYLDEMKMSQRDQATELARAQVTAENIAYEDDWLIVVNKMPGVPTQPTIDPNRPNLFDLTKKFLAQRSKSNQEPYLGLHHRLDRDTSGLVLFTKKEVANKGVAELFSQHRLQKTYHCLVWRTPQAPIFETADRFEINNFLGRISAKNETSKFGSVKSGGDPAHTFFRVLEVFRDAYWLEAKPKTGRTHQIRVHASEYGLPILGDPLYFPKNVFALIKAPRLLLHAYQLEFEHPVTGKSIKVEAQLPEDFFKVLGNLKA